MNCPKCAAKLESSDKRCPECGHRIQALSDRRRALRLKANERSLKQVSNCPKCEGELQPDENYCPDCGHKIRSSPEQRQALRRKARERAETRRNDVAMTSGRNWILAVAILTLIGGVIFFFIQKAATEKEIREAEATRAQFDPEAWDTLIKAETGMSWDEAVARDRSVVTLILVVNIVLAFVYLGLWFWAKFNTFAAALTALIIYLTVIAISGVLEPATLLQGILIKVLVVVALFSAVAASYRARHLAAQRA